jgi:hypothetical protein
MEVKGAILTKRFSTGRPPNGLLLGEDHRSGEISLVFAVRLATSKWDKAIGIGDEADHQG